MPVKRKRKTKYTQKAKTSTLKTIFNRFNEGKITAKGVQQFFIAIFYRIGYTTELTVLSGTAKMQEICYIIYKTFKKIIKEIKIFINRMFDTMFEDIGKPLSRIRASITNIKGIAKQAKADKSIKATKEIKAYVSQGVKKHKSLVPSLVSYVVPLVCFTLMFVVINMGLARNYVVSVVLDGEEIGLVDNFTVLKNANNVIKNKLVTLNDEQQWSINPEIHIVPASVDQVVDERQLSDSILKASDEDIVSATGLYVDGAFYGALENSQSINTALESMLAPYKDDNPDKNVTFLQDVSVLDGVFFTDTLAKEDEIVNLITGEVAGEQYYTVVKGDSPSLIAQKNNLRLKQLYELNPTLEGGGMWVGDQLLISQAVPFLQVKETVRESYTVEIPYKSEQKPNNSMTLGTTKTAQKGEKGENLVTSDFVYIDGLISSETVVSTEVIKEPVNEIIEVGRLIPSGGVLEAGGTGAYGWPTGGGVRVSRGFAGQFPAHNGIDIAGPYGTAILASDSGVVTKAVYTNSGYGVYLIVDHGNGYQTLYGHCSSLLVGYGERVSKGQVIARMGSTGNSTGNHLHFEIKSGNTRYDPYRFF